MNKTIGQRQIVTRNGYPIADIHLIPPRRFASRAVIAEAASQAPSIDAVQFLNDVDAVIGQSVGG